LKLCLATIGRLKKGPEHDLVTRYQTRIEGMAPLLGFAPKIIAIEGTESRARSSDARRHEEAEWLLAKTSSMMLITFDERGQSWSSEIFATKIGTFRDQGCKALALVIGGPDGLDDRVRQRAEHVLSFGKLTLPHQIVRVLVVEQLYRSLTILAGHPYHRGDAQDGDAP
jgi:23S rRNA (pseudouridine1915-N3)-methyltransferase